MTTELYKRYRPKTLERVIGNEETVAMLAGMVAKKTVPHCILFSGPSGCGKTTLARIVKDTLQCHDLDFREINSSSFRGIDSIRDMQRTLNLAPSAGPVRVWLFDEVHKWTNDAQNAALKMLEDTPSHVYFLLCTTDPDKLIKPIQTRCCQLAVEALAESQLQKLAERVCAKEKINLSAKDMTLLTTLAQGSARTLLVLLDKIAHLPAEKRAAAIERKLAEESAAIDLCRVLMARTPKSWKRVAEILKGMKDDPETVRWAVLGYARSVLLSSGTWEAYNVILSFQKPFYDSKSAGLAAACYEVLEAEK